MASRLAQVLIALYQKLLSPLLPPACRFYPSCSEYAREAFEKHGFFRGGALAARRILRCNPLHPGGFDPVPDRSPEKGGAKSG
ncbi:membrane protein insertion efficiency factor YidD [bacterium]|nr:MAG: membrane protein insertion efficiency factor YidD [bacterium]